MDGKTISYVLYLWVATAVVTESSLILFGSTFLTTAGTVLIIIGLVSLMPAMRYAWWDTETPE